MSLYVDTSCLLKLFLDEPDAAQVDAILAAHSRVFVSSLGVVEAHVRFQRLRHERIVTARGYKQLCNAFESMLAAAPFEVVELDNDIFILAVAQTRATQYCKTFDRLHLAAAMSLRAKGFLTSDAGQARAAKALKLKVLTPY